MCSLASRIRQLVEALPEGASVTLPREQLVQMLEECEADAAGPKGQGEIMEDLTVEQIVAATGRAPSTVCGWMPELAGYGAYKLGREWRVPPAAWEKFLERRRAGKNCSATPGRRSQKVDTGSWRKYRKAG